MAISELASLGRILFELVPTIQGLGENYFRPNATWNDAVWNEISSQVSLLRATLDGLQEMLKRFGLAAASLLEAVKEEKKLLDGEVAKLEKRRAESQASICTCYSMCRMLFPKSLGSHTGVAEYAYEPISHNLITQLRIYDVLEELERASSSSFHIDSRYVPLRSSEEKVFSALETEGQDPYVVLLYGKPGKGKSTLASQASLRYRDENSPFTQVVMLECGPNIDVAAKQTELLQKLGQESTETFQGDDFTVMKLLQTHLRKQKVLIILDDLWEWDLMDSLLNLSRSGVKFLITSELADLSKSLPSKDKALVLIENIKHDDSRKIIATHAGFEDQDIPWHLQELADRIIVQAEANPLVLVKLGVRIARAGRDELEAWEDMLGVIESAPLHSGASVEYPRSFLAAVKVSVAALSREQKQLLVLVGMCGSPSASKSSLQFLYCTAILPGCNWAAFRTLSNLLKSRNLLIEKDPKLLAIHSLTKAYILDYMTREVMDVLFLLNKARKRKASSIVALVTSVLLDLYIDAEVGERAAMLDDQSSGPLLSSERSRSSIYTRRSTSESLTQLLVLEATADNKWTEELGTCASQVFVDFVRDDLLCDSDISMLLASATAIKPMLTFLKNAHLAEGSFWKKNFTQPFSSIPHSLLCILRDSSYAEYQAGAALILADICWCHKDSCTTILNISGMLPQLAVSLTQDENSDLQRNAAIALSDCAYWHALNCHDTIIAEILNVSGLLNSLVDLLAKDKNPGVQTAAARALGNLALAKQATIKDTLASQPGLLARLGDSLLSENTPLQEHAAQALWNLVEGEEQALCDKLLLYHPGLIDKMVCSSMPRHNPRRQPVGATDG